MTLDEAVIDATNNEVYMVIETIIRSSTNEIIRADISTKASSEAYVYIENSIYDATYEATYAPIYANINNLIIL